ncbi:DUF2158 domain-containing protein [Pantoea sp. Lij88]|uniref:DUF2158 domain-containing protein n=1 Tax=Pantoea sp. Lij88 TaxID=3028622 RepID=UPI0024BA204B|nr:DUF2158 domain-containing protein [Pantoea sp. Lij88]WHQ73430.1 DUF2158 domain-containing protein [Pantoea sp. Lij88]
MTQKFDDGTVVQLKSGGPLMTISFYDEERAQYYCEWFVKDDRKSGFFSGASLSECH